MKYTQLARIEVLLAMMHDYLRNVMSAVPMVVLITAVLVIKSIISSRCIIICVKVAGETTEGAGIKKTQEERKRFVLLNMKNRQGGVRRKEHIE